MPDSPNSLPRSFVRRTFFVFASAAVVFIAWQLANVALLAFAAVIVAVLLRTIAEPISAHSPLSEGLSLLVAVVIIVGLLTLAGWLFGSTVRRQVEDLVAMLPKSPEALHDLLGRLPFGEEFANQVTDIGGWASRMEGVAGRVSGYALNAASALTNIVLVIVAGVFIAIKPRETREGLLLLLPESTVEPVREALNTTGRALSLWLWGTFADMAVVGILTGIGTAIIGLPSPLALALFAGLASFVPIVGPIVSVVPAVLLALQVGPEMVLWTILVYIAVQQIESNLIFPFIQRRAVDLAPSMTLFGVLGFGVLLGPLGVVLATPLLVVLTVLVKILYVRRTLGKDVTAPGESS